MATEEHKYLADFIKRTHATLREEAQNYGHEIAWRRHVARKDVLQKYAASMQALATSHWVESTSNSKHGTHCRLEWIKSQCKEYFLNGGREKYDEREASIKLKINMTDVNVKNNVNYTGSNEDEEIRRSKDILDKITLLDVGSCYNPFKNEEAFDVTAIDLIGIPGMVLKCDFLDVRIGNDKILSSNEQEILQLQESSFDTIVFSLLLEYLPSPEQRYLCCEKAYNLLKPGGILFIISPDSKHVGANAKFMKSWRYALSKLGFMRIKYEKLQHIHCLIFRRCIFKNVATRWADLQNLPIDDPLYLNQSAIYIPQDFRDTSNQSDKQGREEFDASELTSMFSELPFDTT